MFIDGQPLSRLGEALQQEHLQEEETIQLINFYGKQLIDKLGSQHQQQTVSTNTDGLSMNLLRNIDNNDLTEEFQGENSQRKYERERHALEQTINRAHVIGRNKPQPRNVLLAEIQQTQRRFNTSPRLKASKQQTPIQEKKMQMPYQQNKQNPSLSRKDNHHHERPQESRNKFLINTLQSHPQRTSLTPEKHKDQIQKFVQRMEEDSKRRKSSHVKNKLLTAAIEQQSNFRSQHYRSTTPTKNPKDETLTTKEIARRNLMRRKKQLQEEYEKQSYTPSLSPGLQPRMSKYGTGSPKRPSPVKKSNRVVHLSSPDELGFLVQEQ